ncbi:MAG: hypothetical protein ABIB43_05520 [archaeon]
MILKLFLIMVLLFCLSLIQPTSANNEITINLSVNVIEPMDESKITGEVIYESDSEINKHKITYIIIATFLLLLIILIWKKVF